MHYRTSIHVLVLMLAACGGDAFAQQRPAPPAAPTARPSDADFEAAKAAFEALPEAERKAVQDALVWTGDYNAGTGGEFGRRTFEAINAYARRARLPANGTLDPQARKALLAAGQRARDAAKFTVLQDPKTGVQIGVPERLLVKRDINPNGGARWQSADGRITLDTRALAPGEADIEALYERNLSIQTPGRQVTYKLLRPDFFVIAGETPTGKFYMRYGAGPQGLRGFTIGYDKAVAKDFDRTVLAIANSFAAYPSAGAAVAAPRAPAEPGLPAQAAAAQGLIGTGIVVGPDLIITSSAVDACSRPRAAGSAVNVAKVDKGAGLALLERRGPGNPRPIEFKTGDRADEKLLVISYAAGSARDAAEVVVTPADSSARGLIAPLQAGASGAAVVDRTGALVGLVGALPPAPARIAGIVPAMHQAMIPAERVAAFVKERGAGAASAPATAALRTAGEIASEWRTRVVPIMCN